MGKKYYAVYKGKEGNKIYLNWDEAKVNVDGIKGVKYKGFSNIKEAQDFINSSGDYSLFKSIEDSKKTNPFTLEKRLNEENNKREENKEKEEFLMDGKYHAYVDGSFRQGYSCYGYGAVIIKNGEVIKKLSGAEKKEEYVSMRNVAGEVKGAMEVIKWAISQNIKEISIYYDYLGIECWALGTWKRNNDLTIGYNNFFKKIKDKIKINFIKVKGHSGDFYNDMVDKLAKDAVLNF